MASPKYSARPGLRKKDVGIRKVAPTYGRATHLTHAPKSHGDIAVESPSERLVSQLLGLDPSVRSFQPQPFTVDVLQGELLHNAEQKASARQRDRVRGETSSFYTPDFMVSWSLGARTAVEVKTQGWDGDDAYRKKLARAQAVLREQRIDFVRVTVPSYWRHPLLTNAPLLHQAARRGDLRPDLVSMEQTEMLANSGASTLGQFCAGLGLGMNRAPVLIVFGALKVDFLTHPLKSDTPALPAYGELDHLSVLDALAS